MAFDAKPSTWIPNWSEDAENITVPIATFPELTAAEADATAGDCRKVWFALLEQLYQKWLATATADRPTKMLVYKSASTNVETGVITNTYTIQFLNAILTQDVSAES